MSEFDKNDENQTEEPQENLKSAAVHVEPLHVVYCPTCSLPPEYCEYGSTFEECAPWILQNMPEVLSETYLASVMSKANIDDNDENKDDEVCTILFLSFLHFEFIIYISI